MHQTAINQELFSFIKESPTSYHAVDTSIHLLQEEGFQGLSEQEAWNLVPGGKYFVSRNQTALLAFRMPKKLPSGLIPFQIIASHSDSPCLKLKEQAEINVEHLYTTLNVEKYGGALLAPWFDRPLSIAGRVFVKAGNSMRSQLVHLDRDLAIIPNLAIHLNRSANDGYTYRVQKDMLPLIGSGQEDFSVKSLIAEELQINEDAILSMDLSLYNRMEGCIWGAQNEFISCPRLDDLQCAFTSLKALTGSCHPEILPVSVIFDTEEVGSQSRQGACSTFMKDILSRICITLGYSREDIFRVLSCSFLLSADSGHALHPNYKEKADPTHHPSLNGGVLMKFSSNQKYTSDGLTGGVFRMICDRAHVPYQIFYNHSDEPGGSTLGNLSMSQISIPTADIGTALLAMHSPYETGGSQDTEALLMGMTAYYQTKICCTGDGAYHFTSS